MAAAPNRLPSRSELVIYYGADDVPSMSWRIYLSVDLANDWRVLVDAQTGETRLVYNRVARGQTEGSGIDSLGETRSLDLWLESAIFQLIDRSKPMFEASGGEIITRDSGGFTIDSNGVSTTSCGDYPAEAAIAASSSADSGWDPAAVSAAYGFSRVYDYYLEVHERDSYDGNGASLFPVVNAGSDCADAYYITGSGFVVFGGGAPAGGNAPYAAAVDVLAHELTHGVIDTTAGLTYRGASGALNEAFADVLGIAAEAWVQGEDPDWIIGEDTGAALRDLSNPTLSSPAQPAHNDGYVSTTEDNGGVHTNSGIINKAFYLLAEGMEGGIGISAAAAIFYEALEGDYLQRNSSFIEAAVGIVNAAVQLHGEESLQARQTQRAFEQVGIFLEPVSDDPEHIAGATGSADSLLFLEWNDTNSSYSLGRFEEALGDDADGVLLFDDVAYAKPAVLGDGTELWFMPSDLDLCSAFTQDASPNPRKFCVLVPGV
ncbi:MAG: M4 family metallopeptidase, partial [Myxococcota bacterium]